MKKHKFLIALLLAITLTLQFAVFAIAQGKKPRTMFPTSFTRFRSSGMNSKSILKCQMVR